MDESEIIKIKENYQEALQMLSEMYRYRVLTYGPEAAKLLLRSFDDLGRLLEE